MSEAPNVAAQHRIPLRVVCDPAHGGRWTSLRGEREWLWRRAMAGRDAVAPGDAFVDAGGLEECVPTVRGIPDHGDAWSRPWRVTGPQTAAVDCPDFSLTRRLTDRSGVVVAEYRLRAEPGYRFVWAAHALLELSPRARLVAPVGTPTRLYPEAAPLVADGRWPDGAPWRCEPWPEPAGLPLHRFGPDDGTAVGAILVGCTEVQIVDGTEVLVMRIESAGQPTAVALWRNLRGWPADCPYRSTGVEPMLGTVFDRREAVDVTTRGGPGAGAHGGDVAVVPSSGEVSWRLTIAARRSTTAGA